MSICPRVITCKSELIATCTVGCAVEWARQVVQELGYAQGTTEIGVDKQVLYETNGARDWLS